MALSRRAKLAIGGTVLAGAAALTTTGMAFAGAERPTLRITETVDDGGVTGAADGGDCAKDGAGGTDTTDTSGSAASER